VAVDDAKINCLFKEIPRAFLSSLAFIRSEDFWHALGDSSAEIEKELCYLLEFYLLTPLTTFEGHGYLFKTCFPSSKNTKLGLMQVWRRRRRLDWMKLCLTIAVDSMFVLRGE
jgi:hypothetical protein